MNPCGYPFFECQRKSHLHSHCSVLLKSRTHPDRMKSVCSTVSSSLGHMPSGAVHASGQVRSLVPDMTMHETNVFLPFADAERVYRNRLQLLPICRKLHSMRERDRLSSEFLWNHLSSEILWNLPYEGALSAPYKNSFKFVRRSLRLRPRRRRLPLILPP